MMTYSQAIEYLYNSAPLFQNIGAGAYKEGLSNTLALDVHFAHPHRSYRTIHVAGTNGKGSTSHTLAAILQRAGYRVGLYTSPHLVDFRERIRVNGAMIPRERVVDFVEHERDFFEPLHPSFFELTTALAFKYFEEEGVDVAVIEVGLGGRLDCTNIISPVLSVITNISFDHVQFLGNTLPMIAAEKAGIIKPGVPVVVGETGGVLEVREVFAKKAKELKCRIMFADEVYHEPVESQLRGLCQEKNTQTVLTAVECLRGCLDISDDAVRKGFAHVCDLTGLMGRWQIIGREPLVICDTGHNVGGWSYIAEQLSAYENLHVVIGMVSDKDVSHVLSLLPRKARYYFTQASVRRAMPVEDFARLAEAQGLHGVSHERVADAYDDACRCAGTDGVVFVGGSTFVVADLLSYLTQKT